MRIEPDGGGSVLHLTESGFRDKGWDAATLETQYMTSKSTAGLADAR